VNTLSKRTVAGLGTMATILGVHWSIQASPTPLAPASTSLHTYAEADRATKTTIERLSENLPEIAHSAAQATLAMETVQNELHQAVTTDQQLKTVETTDLARLSAVQAQLTVQSNVTPPPVHTVTGASGISSDDSGGGDDDGGGDD